MRPFLLVLLFSVALFAATPASAQLRDDVQKEAPKVQIFESNASFTLDKLFDPAFFRMGHAYQLSVGALGNGTTGSLGLYTNSLMWQFSNKLAARVDVGVAHSPFGSSEFSAFGQNNGPRAFLQNAEIAWRPSESTTFHFAFRQAPHGTYASPYGYYGAQRSPFSFGDAYHMEARFGPDEMFWRN